MIQQLEKRLARLNKEWDKNEKSYKENIGIMPFEVYFNKRYEIDRKIAAVFELHRKNVKEQEFSDSQLDVWFDRVAN